MKPSIVHGKDARTLDVLGFSHVIHAGGAETGNVMECYELVVPPGAGVPPHVHTREDEIFQVLEGQVAMTLGDQKTNAGPGSTLIAPRGVAHSYTAMGSAPARVFVTIAPAGLEAMFTELSRLPAGPPDMTRVAGICGRFGISFVSDE